MRDPIYVIDPEISYFTGPPIGPRDPTRGKPDWTVKAVGAHLEEGFGYSFDEARIDFHYRKLLSLIRKHLGTDTRPACETDRLLRRRATP